MSADPKQVKMFQYLVFSKLEGAVTAGMMYLGDTLGLYRHIAEAGPIGIDELSERAGLHPRWVREWAHNQVAAKVLEGDADTVSLSAAGQAVLADPTSPAFAMGSIGQLPQYINALDDVQHSFVTGIGHDYDSHGHEGAVGVDRSFEPWNRNFLVPKVIPSLEGVEDKLRNGAAVADIGCGAGSAVMLLAEAFPTSTYTGYDISQHALGLARQRAQGHDNVAFVDPRQQPLPGDHSLDVVFTFDCLHDMTHPREVVQAIADSLKPDGTWLLVDVKALDSFEENLAKNPMAALMYGISVLHCMSSAMSASDGAGLGTLGLPESKAREMAAAAGLTRFRKLDIDHGANFFYEIRP